MVVTADDFGADIAVNAAVEQAFRHGMLTAASLMIAGDAAGDAVTRARAMPGLGVGLHVVLVEGKPVSPAANIPDLVNGDGRFRTDMVTTAIAIFARPSVRRQVRAEVEAQFAAFAATGLPLDHVNAHKHFHLHPTIAAIVLEVGKRYGMRAIRAPVEPRGIVTKVEPGGAPSFDVAHLWALLVRRRMRAAGMMVPDQVFGLAWSGGFDTERLRGILTNLPDGLTELYFHPATNDHYPHCEPGYAYRDELAALVDAGAMAIADKRGAVRGRWADFS